MGVSAHDCDWDEQQVRRLAEHRSSEEHPEAAEKATDPSE